MKTSSPSALPSITNPNDRFGQIPKESVPRSTFDRSHTLKTTFDSGQLIPIFWDQVVPGDTHNLKLTSLARLSTPIVPVMDNIWAETFFFFVPYRLIWDNWERFCGAQTDPGDSTAYVTPKIECPAVGFAEGSLFDYLAIKPQITGNLVPWSINAFNARAYNLIWNDWFRDENLQNSLEVHKGNGPDPFTDYFIQTRGRRPNYFTTCLPFPQKGPALTIPLSATAPVESTGAVPTFSGDGSGIVNQSLYHVTGGNNDLGLGSGGGPATQALFFGNQTGLRSNLASAAGTINELRQAEQLQVLLERDARGGTRFTEVIRQHFGVISDDARLQRPEYLGGGMQRLNFTPIPQTSVTSSTPQGNLAATGTFGGSHGGFTKSFTEHGVIIGLMALSADQTYQDGIERDYWRNTRYDFFWPALQNLGEQSVLEREIRMSDSTDRDRAFGYQERYGDMKHKISNITGKFRTNATGSLDFWHLAMDYSAGVTLNGGFIEDRPPIQRILAVPSEPDVLLDCYFKYTSARPMQTHSIPGGRL